VQLPEGAASHGGSLLALGLTKLPALPVVARDGAVSGRLYWNTVVGV